jgi:signal transduction histidine kinase
MKLLKKISIIMTLVLSITAFYGCKSKEPSPSDTVKTYFDEIKGADEATISTLLSNVEETDTNSSKKMITEIQKLTYTINSESIDGEKATVNVKVNGPDMAAVIATSIQEMFTSVLSQAFSGTEMTEAEQNKLYDDIMVKALDGVTFTDRTGDITLEKSENGWEITSDNEITKLIMNIDPTTFDPDNTDIAN